jgi:hypothetical protein
MLAWILLVASDDRMCDRLGLSGFQGKAAMGLVRRVGGARRNRRRGDAQGRGCPSAHWAHVSSRAARDLDVARRNFSSGFAQTVTSNRGVSSGGAFASAASTAAALAW